MIGYGQIMGEAPAEYFCGTPLRRLGRGPCSGCYAIDSRDLAVIGHRKHQHTLAACRAALRGSVEAQSHIFAGRYKTRFGQINPRFLLTERGCVLAMEHLKNRLGLNKQELMLLLRVAFDRAAHGVRDPDPPLAEPSDQAKLGRSPDSEIRPPEVETALDAPILAKPVVQSMMAFMEARARDPVSAGPVVDFALQRRINGAIAVLASREAGLPVSLRSELEDWHRRRLDDAWEHLRSWDDLDRLYAS